MSNLETVKSSVIYSALSAVSATGVINVALSTATAPFYPQCSKILGVKPSNAVALGVPANLTPYVDTITVITSSATRACNVALHFPAAAANTYDGAIYQLFWQNESLPTAGFC